MSPHTQKAVPPSKVRLLYDSPHGPVPDLYKEKLSAQVKIGEKLHSLLKSVVVKDMLEKKGSSTVIVVDEGQTVFEAVRLMVMFMCRIKINVDPSRARMVWVLSLLPPRERFVNSSLHLHPYLQ